MAAVLAPPPESLVTPATPLEWVEASPAAGGGTVLVPRDLIAMGRRPRGRWQPGRLAATCAGLAADASRPAALARALRDLAARDAAAMLAAIPPSHRAWVDPGAVPDPWCAAVARGIRDAGGAITAAAMPAWPGMACFGAWVWLPGDRPLAAAGAGASPDPAAALRAAVQDAARERACLVGGIASAPGGRRHPPGTCRAARPRRTPAALATAGGPARVASARRDRTRATPRCEPARRPGPGRWPSTCPRPCPGWPPSRCCWPALAVPSRPAPPRPLAGARP